MITSESIKNIASAMIKFHGEVASIPKTASNPFFKSKYVPLDKILSAIHTPLQNAGLSFVQFPSGENNLTTRLMHESGEFMEDTFYMKPDKTTPQAYGSVITYQRRYALSAILGLNTDEDDDGNEASKEGKKESKKPELTPEHEGWEKAIDYIAGGGTIKDIKGKYEITEDNAEALILAGELHKEAAK